MAQTKIPFDYARWKAGDYVRLETRDGREVLQGIETMQDDPLFPLRFEIKDDKGFTRFTKSGTFYAEIRKQEIGIDIFMIVEQKEIVKYCNVYENLELSSNYDTIEECKSANVNCISISKITFINNEPVSIEMVYKY